MPPDAAPSPVEYPFASEDFQFFKNQLCSFPVLGSGDTNWVTACLWALCGGMWQNWNEETEVHSSYQESFCGIS